ncbi:MAG TPA: hypothetical protein VNO33_12625 [Kofleriaceae bacterium]|nr:hypothetical protein [Kofleriaceae bacterium]
MSKNRTSKSQATGRAAPMPLTEGDAELAKKLEDLTPEQAELFVRALHLAMRKRRILLVGYLATAISVVLGWLWALYIYGKTRGSGEFMAWVFLVPPALGAIVLVTFGRISRRLRD